MKKITLWVAKDNYNSPPRLFFRKPKRRYNAFFDSLNNIKEISKHLFPKLTYENSPQKINLLIEDENKIIKFYKHLLDLVEKERLSPNFSEFCDLETEFIKLFGEELFRKHNQHEES